MTWLAAECFATLAQQAQADGRSHVDYLAAVIAEQAAATQDRRLSARLRYARFPSRRSIGKLAFFFQPSIDRKVVDVGVQLLMSLRVRAHVSSPRTG